MDVSIICVNWNSLQYLLECLTSVYKWTVELSFEVIVVDNASPTGNLGELEERFPDVILIKSEQNRGFATANNIGAAAAQGRYLLFVNPDTTLVNNAVRVMLSAIADLPLVGVVGCKLLNGDMSVQTSSILRFPRPFDSLLQIEALRVRWPTAWGIGPLFNTEPAPARVEAVSGACMLISRRTFDSVGGFSPDYFMYSEDVDLCFKVHRAGLRNYYIGRATIVHYGGKSSSPTWQTVMKTKAELYFCEKHYGRLRAVVFRVVSVVGAALRLAILACARLFTHGGTERLNRSQARWRAILRTLLTEWKCGTAEMPT
jgi:GT2 family glycosyltransferase